MKLKSVFVALLFTASAAASNGLVPNEPTQAMLSVALPAAENAYTANYDANATRAADWGNYELVQGSNVKPGTSVVQFDVYHPASKAHDKVQVTVKVDANDDVSVLNTTIEYVE